MRNIFILYIPPGNLEAMIHYEDTIRKRVNSEKVFAHVDSSLRRRLESVFGQKPIAVWGSRDSAANRGKFDRMEIGDEVLIVEGPIVKLLGRVAAKTVNSKLSQDLWKNIHGGVSDGWDLIYFIANPREIDVPFSSVRELLGYSPDFQLRGFTAVAAEKLETFYSIYDDLYSILVAKKDGLSVQKIPEAIKTYKNVTGNMAVLAEEIPKDDVPDQPREISDHVWMQWTLLRMGRQAGQKVWAPRNDQSRITAAHNFTDFEPTFASGLDTQVKYVENIDVVWKEEFRIDAAFEVENSTSIYSGLLRFADLTMVAPNTHYPLFIVAPGERRNRVREQLARPSFKQLKIAEKVRFLSYDKVREIDDFFGPEGKGVSVEIISNRAENLSV